MSPAHRNNQTCLPWWLDSFQSRLLREDGNVNRVILGSLGPGTLSCRLLLLGRVLCCLFYVLVALLNLCFFLCPRTERDLFLISQYCPSPLLVTDLGVGIPFVTHLRLSCWFLCLWWFSSCSGSPRSFFRRNCSINDVIWCVLWGEGSSESSYAAILNWNWTSQCETQAGLCE